MEDSRKNIYDKLPSFIGCFVLVSGIIFVVAAIAAGISRTNFMKTSKPAQSL